MLHRHILHGGFNKTNLVLQILLSFYKFDQSLPNLIYYKSNRTCNKNRSIYMHRKFWRHVWIMHDALFLIG